MTPQHHLAADLGAGSARLFAGAFDGARVTLREFHRFDTSWYDDGDGARWNIGELVDQILNGASRAARELGSLESLGVDAWGVDYGLLAEGELLADPRSYRDARGENGVARISERIGLDRVAEITGVQVMPFNTIFQLAANADDPLHRRADGLLFIPDLVGFLLTGVARVEATIASTSQLVDILTGGWSTELLDAAGVPANLFMQPRPSGQALGGLQPQLAAAHGLEGLAVQMVASHDTASAVVGTPLGESGCAFISSGTWSLVGVELDRPLRGPRVRELNFSNESGFGGTTRMLKNITGLWLLQECRRVWAADGANPSYEALIEEARQAPAGGPLFDPDEPDLLRTAQEMPAKIAALCERSGQRAPQDRAEIVRSILESLACKYRLRLDQLEELTGRPIDTVHVVGGGSMNTLLCQLTADVSGRRVLAGPVEAAALGNVMVQLVVSRELASLREIRTIVRASVAVTEYEPNSAAGAELYARFAESVLSAHAPVAT